MGQVMQLKQPADMSEEELKARWEQIRTSVKDPLRADLLAEAVRRHMTQDRIAKVIGKSKGYVCNLLQFGAFIRWCNHEKLATANIVDLSLHSLTERHFREHFAKTKGMNEWQRFKQTVNSLHEEQQREKPTDRERGIAEKIKKCGFADGKPHNLRSIAEKIGETKEDVKAALDDIATHKEKGLHQIIARRPAATGVTYVINKAGGRMVDVDALYERVRPWLDELKEMGNVSHRLHLSPQDISALAYRIEREMIGSINRITKGLGAEK